MAFDRADLDRVRTAADIVDLVGEVTKVKRTGRSYVAVCPFHQEKTPSLSLDRTRGLYHCFGCGKSGDVFTFVQETQGLDFTDAVEHLARRTGITVRADPQAAKNRGRREAWVTALRRAVDFYHQRLKTAPEAGPARAYLRGRGYDVDVIDSWKLGFSGTDWDSLTRELRASGTTEKVLNDSGLARRGRHGYFDVFRGRLMFPIHDLRGDVVGFGARRVEGVDPEATSNAAAKYINSADSPLYHKAQLLFGLDRAKQAMATEKRAVVVEGYTDVIAMHMAGIGTAVATCGTALGEEHFDLIRRFTDRIVLAFDADEAGAGAALRGDELKTPFRLDLDLRVASMPPGQDPADLVQVGKASDLVAAVEDARPLLEFRIVAEVGRFDITGPEGRARALHAAVGQLKRVDDEIARREYARFVARQVGVDLGTVEAALGARRGWSQDPGDAQVAAVDRGESEALRLLIAQPGSVAIEPSLLRDRSLAGALEALTAAGGSIDEVTDESLRSLLLRLSLDSRPLPAVVEVETWLRERRRDHEMEALKVELEGTPAESPTYSEILRRLIALQQEKHSPQEQ